jgi:hypothetical protein
MSQVEVLDKLMYLCEAKQDIKFTRFFGAGTFHLIVMLVIGTGMM